MGDGNGPQRRSPAWGWSRVTVVVFLLAAAVAVIAWNLERAAPTVPPVSAGKEPPEDKARTPVSRQADTRDTSRERPERERTSRPGESQKN